MTTSLPQHSASGVHACLLCDWHYDPALGDSERGIAPGTPWESLPADWTCPECGADPSAFDAI
ncbi:MAG: rubredoxin [Achromobacter sp.]|nr:rubredoxin [Achromobacter sp.]